MKEIAYPQDRNAREWTFGYYLNDAGFRLHRISKKQPSILNFTEDNLATSSKETWTRHQAEVRKAISELYKKLNVQY